MKYDMSRNPYLFSLILPFILPAMAATPAPSGLPPVDFSRMGTVGLGGSFAGLDWWSDDSPFSSSSSSNATSRFSAEGDTVFVRDGDGNYRPIGATNAGGQVRAVCWVDGNGGGSGTVIAGGTFTSVEGHGATNIAAYSLSSSSWGSLGDGLSGGVNVLYCDSSNDEVWVGGQFNGPSGNGSNIARWSTSSSAWESIPFGGLNGVVNSISTSGDNILFGGSFTTMYSSNSTNNITTNYTSAPSAPANTSTTGNSGYLTPVTLPGASSASGELTITAGPTTSDSRYSDPRVMLCPGSGTWLAREGQVSDVYVQGYNFWRATGARVSNGLVEGRGTTSFCITSLPDNVELNMTYTDPATGQNQTCAEHCPLSTDRSIGAQDFIFTDGVRNMTGLKVQLKEWTGAGAGLNSIELLSDGAFASASSDANQGVCRDSQTSRAGLVGDWTQGTVSTTLPATTAYYLKSTVPASHEGQPGVTFYPIVSSSGYYDVYLTIPACEKTEDCASRTTVDVEVFPGGDGLGWTSTISQVTSVDLRTLVYSGWIDRTSEDFTPTVILQLALDPESTSSGQYSIVAQSVELHLTGIGSPDEPPRTSPGGVIGQNGTIITNSTRVSNTSTQASWGVFQWARGSGTINAMSGMLPNTSQTSATRLGSALGTARNATSNGNGSGSGSSNWTIRAAIEQSNTIIVGGTFEQSGNWTNVLSIDTTNNVTASLPDRGLNGAVMAGAAVNGRVYLGGNFTSTAGGGTELRYVAAYDPSDRSWHSLQGGVDGAVLDISARGNSVLISGNFTNVIQSNGSTIPTGGYALYDTRSNSWNTAGILFGTLSAASAGNDNNVILAGRVLGSSSNSVNGIAMLTTGRGGAEINTLGGIAFSSSGSGTTNSNSSGSNASTSTTNSNSNSNSNSRREHDGRSWISRLTHVLDPRAEQTVRAPAPVISAQPASAPAVLAGAYWTNSSSNGNGRQVTIIGGNFSTSSSIGGLAFYSDSTLTGPSPSVTGVVRTIAVVGNTLYAAGSGVNVTGVGSGLVAYDLANNRWATNGAPPSLSAPQGGAQLRVNVLKIRQDTNYVVAAGNFGQAGSLGCAAVCLWNGGNGQWQTPGSGLSSGEVRAVDFAGDDYDILVVAGSFVLSSGATTYVAAYSFANSTWTALGSLPGPALAVAVDNKNANSIFASGYADSDGAPYLSQWTGSSWSAQNASLLPGSIVTQLAFVPLTREHSASGSIERDRMLMISGNLILDGKGNATSALYDGNSTHPYLVGVTNAGALGSAGGIFWSESSFDFSIRRTLAVGLVVLVAIAIATGLILLLILLFLLIGYCLRRRERKGQGEKQEMYNREPSGSDIGSTHQNVLHTVQDALQATLLGGGAGADAGAAAAAAAKHRSADSAYTDGGPYAAGAGAAGAAGAGGHEEEEDDGEGGRETTMRYDFDGPELQPGEMSMRAGQRVIVLDDQQSEEWWYCRDPSQPDREGVVPATYVW